MIPHLKTGSAQSAPWVDTGVIYVSRKKCADRSMEVEVSFFGNFDRPTNDDEHGGYLGSYTSIFPSGG